jgi:hypothetical protein|tara:strand:- start:249 stop:416 length:168 start_codon:yes stop_codon:yes gene_type:complete
MRYTVKVVTPKSGTYIHITDTDDYSVAQKSVDKQIPLWGKDSVWICDNHNMPVWM